ncbi:nuclear transport factor 2 family protein [Novosphingobium jiangmenense]|uniref:nuclear transport factor 2 family protein n=1 Tax=Novosphingobium jiangmenense TaxID=2791981 RepID=UPI001FE4D4B0|nr:nuclear transport factor 2 family protein [Novosphingobium jiangmenense]
MDELANLQRRVALLEAEAAVRRLLARYLFLCDVPLPEPGMDADQRAEAIGRLFADDGVWQGVGGAHGAQFGEHRGPAKIAAHMRRFFAAATPRQIFNTHYLTSEQIYDLREDHAEGTWVQFQPWVHDDGSALIRSSRLRVTFRRTDGGWKIARYRTENLFIGALPDGWAHTLIGNSVLMAVE